jgi:hypothetical protein
MPGVQSFVRRGGQRVGEPPIEESFKVMKQGSEKSGERER